MNTTRILFLASDPLIRKVICGHSWPVAKNSLARQRAPLLSRLNPGAVEARQ